MYAVLTTLMCNILQMTQEVSFECLLLKKRKYTHISPGETVLMYSQEACKLHINYFSKACSNKCSIYAQKKSSISKCKLHQTWLLIISYLNLYDQYKLSIMLFSPLGLPGRTSKVNFMNDDFIEITEWFGFKRTIKIKQFQPPCYGQRHLGH